MSVVQTNYESVKQEKENIVDSATKSLNEELNSHKESIKILVSDKTDLEKSYRELEKSMQMKDGEYLIIII